LGNGREALGDLDNMGKYDRARNWLDMEEAQAPDYIPRPVELAGRGRFLDRDYVKPLPIVVQEQYESRATPTVTTKNQAYRDFRSDNQEAYTEIYKPPSSGFGSHVGRWDEAELEAHRPWRGGPSSASGKIGLALQETQPGDIITRESIEDAIQQYHSMGFLKPEYQEALLNMPIWRDTDLLSIGGYMAGGGEGMYYDFAQRDNPIARQAGIVGHEFTHYIDSILGSMDELKGRTISQSQEWQNALDTLDAEGRYDLHDLGARIDEDGTIIPEDVLHLWTYYAEQAPWAIPYELRQFFPQFTEESFELPEGYRQVRQDGRLRIADEQGYAPEKWKVHGARGGEALYRAEQAPWYNDPNEYDPYYDESRVGQFPLNQEVGWNAYVTKLQQAVEEGEIMEYQASDLIDHYSQGGTMLGEGMGDDPDEDWWRMRDSGVEYLSDRIGEYPGSPWYDERSATTEFN